jgi:hypothetical protein
MMGMVVVRPDVRDLTSTLSASHYRATTSLRRLPASRLSAAYS